MFTTSKPTSYNLDLSGTQLRAGRSAVVVEAHRGHQLDVAAQGDEGFRQLLVTRHFVDPAVELIDDRPSTSWLWVPGVRMANRGVDIDLVWWGSRLDPRQIPM